MDNERILLDRLDQFIRKYYKNQLIRGALLLAGMLAVLYIGEVLLEYWFRFGTVTRTLLFYAFVVISATGFWTLIILPVLKLFRIGRVLDYQAAARIIGDHFPEIQDKLLNTLQLLRMKQETGGSLDLLLAGIDQKIKMIRPFPFTVAIDIRRNSRYLKWVLPPVILVLAGLLLAPSLVSDPAKRIIRHNTVFVREFPFRIQVLNKNLEALQQDNFEVKIQITGEEIPTEAFIITDGIKYTMNRQKGFTYTYLFRDLQSDVSFRINAGEQYSAEYRIKVYPKPIILNFTTRLDFPAYIRRSSENLENTGDITIPEGTHVTWEIHTRDVDQVVMKIQGKEAGLKPSGENSWKQAEAVFESMDYSMIPGNRFTPYRDSLNFRIQVIKDGYPVIYVEQSKDTTLVNNMFYRGTIKDDYGFTKLVFHYKLSPGGDTLKARTGDFEIPIENELTSQVFYYNADLSVLAGNPGDEVEYYFEVWDNDGINGPKSTKSEIRFLKTLTRDEIENLTSEKEQEIVKDFEGSLSDAKEAKKALDELSRKMVDNTTLDWKEKKQAEDVIKTTEKILDQVENIRKTNENNIQNGEKYLETNKDILEKQKRLNELMDEMMTDEMRKNLQEMKKLLDDADRKKLNEMLDKMKISNKELEQQLDINLALFKQIEFDRKLDEAVKNLREQADKQENLAKDINAGQKNNEKALEEQKEIRKNYDSIQKGLNDLKEKEKELENPPGLEKTEALQDSIRSGLKKSEEKLKEGDSKNSGKSQKETSGQMRKLAEDLENMSSESEMDQMSEDATDVRGILESLLRMSFEQEALMGMTGTVNRNDPKFQGIIVRQKDIKEKLQSAKDTLLKISKTQFMIGPVIMREITAIDKNIDAVVAALNSRNIGFAMSRQQMAMTSINNLALLLDESLQQMNQNMKMSMSGKGQKLCKSPSSKGGKMSAKQMREMQEKMSEKLSKIREGLEKEKKEGKTGQGQGSMSEQVARMAAEQEAIRNELQKYKEELEKEGIKDGGNMSNTINDMEQNERDLLNKKISQETIMRQQRIISRLLESEKAEQTRDKEEKRESREEKEQKYRNFTGDFEYKRVKSGNNELIQYKAAPVNPYYRNRINEYMLKIGQ